MLVKLSVELVASVILARSDERRLELADVVMLSVAEVKLAVSVKVEAGETVLEALSVRVAESVESVDEAAAVVPPVPEKDIPDVRLSVVESVGVATSEDVVVSEIIPDSPIVIALEVCARLAVVEVKDASVDIGVGDTTESGTDPVEAALESGSASVEVDGSTVVVCLTIIVVVSSAELAELVML